MDAINRREHLTHIRRLPVYRAKRNLCQEVKVIVLEERPHAGSPSTADHGPGRLSREWIQTVLAVRCYQ